MHLCTTSSSTSIFDVSVVCAETSHLSTGISFWERGYSYEKTNLQGGRKPHFRLYALKVLPQMCDDVTGEESADSLTLRDEAEVRSPVSL